MKLANSALALSSVMLLGCVGLPPPLPPQDDPASSRAPEAPGPRPSAVLTSDPPPGAALEPPAGQDGMQMDHDNTQMDHGPMKMDHGSMEHGDRGGMPEQHHEHDRAPAAPTPARDGGSP